MTEQEFKSTMAFVEALYGISHRPGYCEGYVRGLRRFYHGPTFGTLNEHETWLSLAYDSDGMKTDRGRGYRDGVQGFKPLT
jgi:hypothetical protein